MGILRVILLVLLSISLFSQGLIAELKIYPFPKYALEFDGTAKYVSTGAISLSNTDTWSVEFYTNNATASTSKGVLGRGSNASRIVFGSTSFRVVNASGTEVTYSHTADISKKVKWKVEYGSDSISIYANDILQDKDEQNGTIEFLYIGKTGSSNYFTGQIWDIKVNKNGSVYRHYPCTEGYSTTLYDVSANSADGTLTEESIWVDNELNDYGKNTGITKVVYKGKEIYIPYFLNGTIFYETIKPVINAAERYINYNPSTWDEARNTGINELIIIAGQSNANGYKVADDTTEVAALNTTPNGYIWSPVSSTYELINYPVAQNNQPFYPTNRWGFLLSMAEYYNDTIGTPAYFYKCANASTSLFSDWMPPSGYMWVNFATNWTTALNNKPNNTIAKYLIWYQGEKDAENEATANAYDTNFEMLYNAIKQLPNANDIKIYICVLNENSVKTYSDIVRNKQLSICSSKSDCYALDMNLFPLDIDNNHHTPQAYYDLGRYLVTQIKM